MEGAAVSEKGWRDLGHSDLHEGKAGAIVFPLSEYLECDHIAGHEDQLGDQDLSLEDEIDGEHEFREIVGNNTRLKGVLENVRIVAPANSSVLILGETGTGKELIA